VGKTLYVGNLNYRTTDRDLGQLLGAYGAVRSAQVIVDRDTGRSKGFGFAEMGSDQEARAAVAALNGKEVQGRCLTVKEANPKEDGGGGRRKGPGKNRAGEGRKRPPALGRRLRRPRPGRGAESSST